MHKIKTQLGGFGKLGVITEKLGNVIWDREQKHFYRVVKYNENRRILCS